VFQEVVLDAWLLGHSLLLLAAVARSSLAY
jgi:hypothetical protein